MIIVMESRTPQETIEQLIEKLSNWNVITPH